MSDEENTTEVENLDTVSDETVKPVDPPEKVEEKPVEPPEPVSLEKKLANKAAEVAAAQEKVATPGDEGKPPEFKPDYKFKASGKEQEVPELFRSLIKDEKTDKEVKSLLSKAYGADALIEKNKKLDGSNSTLSSENANIKSSIDGLRQIYMDAVKHPSQGGNILKMDQFFERLQIPENTILQWAVAKVQLQEMPPEQRNAIVAQMDAEKKAVALTMEQSQLQGQNQDTVRRLKQLELDQLLGRPDMQTVASDFDKRVGKTGSFRDAIIRTGELAWFRQNVDLPPDQAVKQVIEAYGITLPDPNAAAPSQVAVVAPGAGQTRPVVQRTDKVIPNVQGKGSQSPLKDKPRSIEDIKKLAARAAAGEAV